MKFSALLNNIVRNSSQKLGNDQFYHFHGRPHNRVKIEEHQWKQDCHRFWCILDITNKFTLKFY